MSRRANPLDNAPMDSFFHTLKTELVHHRTYATRDETKRDLFAYGKASTTANAFIRLWTIIRPTRQNGEQQA